MTTPESFDKVKTACKRCGLNIYSDFFLLDDECHQLVKDVDFRGDIVLPMDDFFQFEHKALVSATPIKFSDPRFKGFNTIEICADYNYQQDITVTHTYNTVVAVKDYLQNHDGIICVFFNSVEGIISLIRNGQLSMSEENTTVYCAPKSRTKLKTDYGFSNAHHEWSTSTMKKYNFFTARFYTAFDLELDYKPDLLMISFIIPIYNAEPYLVRCIQSVLKQTTSEPLQVILVDDGSTDNSLAIAQEGAREEKRIVS